MLFSALDLVISSPAPEIIEYAQEGSCPSKASIAFALLKTEAVAQNLIFVCTQVDNH